jgi:hypothetical protein
VLSGLHLATAFSAAFQQRALWWLWRMQALVSLCFMLLVGWGILSSAWYLRGVYATLGAGLAGALMGVFAIVVATTLPLACWALAATGGLRWGRLKRLTAGMLVALGLAQVGLSGQDAHGKEILSETEIQEFEAALPTALNSVQSSQPVTPIANRRPIECQRPVTDAGWTVFVTWLKTATTHKVVTRCLQAETSEEVRAFVTQSVTEDQPQGFVKVDLVTRIANISAPFSLVASLSIRQGVDGVCRERRCLLPWQLFISKAFDSFLPVPAVPSARLGTSIAKLKSMLGDAVDNAPIQRVETRG